MRFITLYRDAAAGAGGGTQLPPSMAELEEQARLAREKGEEPEKKDDKNDQIPEGKMKNEAGEIVDDPNYKKPEGDQLPEGKMKDENGNIVDDPDYKKPEEEEGGEGNEGETPDDFWKSVDELTGRNIKVEFPEGIDPLSPQGVVLRENAVREAAFQEQMGEIKKLNPRAYAFLIHTSNGGSEADFFEEPGFTLPERVTVEGDVNLQTQMVKADLISRGVDEDIADATIAKYVKNNQLKEKSLKIYDDETKRQQDHIAEIENRKKAEDARINGLISGLETKVKSLIPNLNFVVPEAQQTAFNKFVMDRMELDPKTNKFYIIQQLGDDPKDQLESLFFQFFKGDLNKIIQKKVSTNASQRLRSNAAKTKTTTKQGEESSKSMETFIPLGSLGNGISKL